MGLIRFLLACAVVLCHTSTIEGYSPVSGNLAVQCFYIISGFYMAMVLTEKYNKPNGLYKFYANRALKIYPAYWFVLFLLVGWSILTYKFAYPSTLDFYIKHSSPSLQTISFLFLINLIILGLDWTFLLGINKSGNLYFTNDFNKTKPAVYNFAFNSIAWTVGVELAYYIIAPWLNKRNWLFLLLLFLVSLSLRIYLAHIYTDQNPWNYMFFPTQIMYFITGMFSYRFYIKFVKDNYSDKVNAFAYTIFLSIILFYYQFFQDNYLKQGVLFLSVALLMPFTFEKTKRNKLDRFFGNLSYPIYISQGLIIKIVYAKRFPKVIDLGFTTVIVVVFFALIINYLIMIPIEKFKFKGDII